MYVTKEKFNIYDLVDVSVKPNRVLVISADEILRQIYQKHLEANAFMVQLGHYKEVLPATDDLSSYDLLILDIVSEWLEEQQKWLRLLRGNHPKVKIVTVGMGLSEEVLTSLMSEGIMGHIDRKLTRPEDLVLLIQSIINPQQYTK